MVRSLGCILTIEDADAPDLKTVTLHIPASSLFVCQAVLGCRARERASEDDGRPSFWDAFRLRLA